MYVKLPSTHALYLNEAGSNKKPADWRVRRRTDEGTVLVLPNVSRMREEQLPVYGTVSTRIGIEGATVYLFELEARRSS